ncbi:hypothetical protein ATPR_3281 [Acetobacter tropicalis NBRC 101654]|uniref:Uncharacterized protein n=1 Tax=Acetobacter tropicalis NBRC 101654 TaxID=749388 RepID=F7VIT1_9PROT|nr:hypothetical protein ATPR_3281 [Acetobacter tropicalis NBRC 101654]
MSDRFDLHRVRNNRPGDTRFKYSDDRHRIAGCLDDDLVRFLQSPAERLQPRAGHVNPTEMTQSAILPENDFGEGAVNIHSYDTTHDLSPIIKTGAAGDATPTDPRSRRNRAGRRGGQLLTRARGSSYKSACPHLRAPGAPVPDGLTIRQQKNASPAETGGTVNAHTRY